MHQDNQSTIAWINGLGQKRKLKHIDVDMHFVKHMVVDGIISVNWLELKLMPADLLTKPLGPTAFVEKRKLALESFAL